MGRLSDKNASYFIPPVLTGARRNELVPSDNFQNQENRGVALGRKDIISPRKRRHANEDHSFSLSEEVVVRLEEIRQRTGKESISAVVAEAVEVYANLRIAEEIAAYEELTPRLRQVLKMIAEGRSTKKIAFTLHVSRKTVEFHRARLMKTLGLCGIADLVRYAIRVGAIMP
jgi:DNA-binding CsgD family transcriptional regulator